jgi:aminopeptidase-like protein
MPSRRGDTRSDRIARHVLRHLAPSFKEYSFLERGSDERQYCSPGVDLPIASVMRSKYATFPEYHTSLDDMNFVTPRGLADALVVYQQLVEALEADCTPVYRVLCEPKMSDRGLRPTLGKRGSADAGKLMMNLLAYADGEHSLLAIAEKLGEPIWELRRAADVLASFDLLRIEP